MGGEKDGSALLIPLPQDGEKLPGVRDIQPLDGGASFLFGGDINALVGQLAACRLTDLSVAEPDLEEIFLHYYTEGGEAK